MLLTPEPECRMRDSALGSTDSGTAPPAPP